jgi:hypothetical protein
VNLCLISEVEFTIKLLVNFYTRNWIFPIC